LPLIFPKGPFAEISSSVNNVAATPSFGRNTNVPFLFNAAPPQTPHTPAWEPPQHSPFKTPAQPEIHDIDMNEATPSKPEENDKENVAEQKEESLEQKRPIATGALRRVFRSRRRTRGRSRRLDDNEDSGLGSESEDDEDEQVALRPQKTSNHYTLNLPAHAPPQSETPYLLLGYASLPFKTSPLD